MPPAIHVPTLGKDGVEHINVYSRGATALGRNLSNWSAFDIVVPDHGRFRSIEGYWFWLSVRDDRLRDLVGWAAKSLGQELRGDVYSQEKDFRERIKVALRCRMEQHPSLISALKATDLPLVHYYVFKGGKMHDITKPSLWMLDTIDEYR